MRRFTGLAKTVHSVVLNARLARLIISSFGVDTLASE